MKDIYLMRHGQTLFNEKMINQGWCDAPLTQLGIHQAQQAAKVLQNKSIYFDQFYVSPLKRAQDTLMIIKEHQNNPSQPIIIENLKEWGFGLLEAESQKILPCRFPWGDLLVNFHGESQDQVLKRILQALEFIESKTPNNTKTLVVMHTCVMRLFMRHHRLLAKVPIPAQLGNCAILHYQVHQGQWNLVEVIEPNDFVS